MCSYLEWKLNFHPAELAEFEAKVRKEACTRNRPSVPPINTALATPPALPTAHQVPTKRTSYLSPPESPTTPASSTSSTVSPQSAALVTPPNNDDASSVASSRSSGMFSNNSSSISGHSTHSKPASWALHSLRAPSGRDARGLDVRVHRRRQPRHIVSAPHVEWAPSCGRPRGVHAEL
ncbi:hypothetical protein EXIGLDRAFT_734516 [Exidia glandulosa HHB12029]|uniref:Uncharacterized protein n=1 Tax=Exidia glandulosa HHB12029 TaxID=1314781 RepID=A0A165PMK5_EXIGL|nr:hypothetical protein EXIGLDRAFT_734516 [Exidia glandulosa HHB12029]